MNVGLAIYCKCLIVQLEGRGLAAEEVVGVRMALQAGVVVVDGGAVHALKVGSRWRSHTQ